MPNDIYLSSTLNDLKDERAAVRAALANKWGVTDSYATDGENNLRDSCVNDVAACSLYIGIVGRRYGYRPPGTDGQPAPISITEMEYQAARQAKIPCLIFLKDDNVIPGPHWDQINGEGDKGLCIERFRQHLASGQDIRAMPFSTLEQLKLEVVRAVTEHFSGGKSRPLLKTDDRHDRELTMRLAVVTDAIGHTDEDRNLQQALQALAARGLPMQLVAVDPGLPHYLDRLDQAVAKAHGVVWYLDSRNQPLMHGHAALLARAMAAQTARRGAVGLITAGTAIGAARPASWALAVCREGNAGIGTALEDCHRSLRLKLPGLVHPRCASLPVIVPAMTQAEAAQLPAGTDASPYGPTRADWRPFAADPRRAGAFIEAAIQRFNNQERSGRERWFIRTNALRLVPHWYSLDDLVQPADGSDLLLQRVRDQGALVLLDEHSLAHPSVQSAAAQLLHRGNAAVVTTTSTTATGDRLQELLNPASPLNVGALLERFADEQDPRCEIALNHPHRLDRWLQMVIPEVLGVLNGQEAQHELVHRANAQNLFAPT